MAGRSSTLLHHCYLIVSDESEAYVHYCKLGSKIFKKGDYSREENFRWVTKPSGCINWICLAGRLASYFLKMFPMQM